MFLLNTYTEIVIIVLEHRHILMNNIMNRFQQGAVVLGFGKTAKKETFSPHLLKTNVWIVDLRSCQNWHSDSLSSTHVCAGNSFNFTGDCNGDFGAPLTANGKVVGIVCLNLVIHIKATFAGVNSVNSKSRSRMQYLGLSLAIALITIQGGLTRIAQSRIVNGAEARPGEFPYQISLNVDGVHDCGGSILNEDYVLTAAHCIGSNDTSILKIIAGTINLDKLSESATIHNVTEINVHKEYVAFDGWNNDIAVLKVDPPFIFNKYIAPAKFPTKNAAVDPEKDAIISGFGRTGRWKDLSPKLLKTKVSTITIEHCQKELPKDHIRLTNVCTQNATADTGFCNGDSGGPLTVDETVVGIVSFALYGGCTGEDRSPQLPLLGSIQ
ncbi:hypothetical protein TSAR_001879 [Trichomalopsis sarcophagae]|uniref:Peptidase S1 domain-containing protein n=1 Tax=Trichomalopsis sarcophagae TaxID=543379 RepID=A0A232FJR3_9HYME|nr:hypothetical protein TSAR_001879 [Trichomalopsis sarcophagae]